MTSTLSRNAVIELDPKFVRPGFDTGNLNASNNQHQNAASIPPSRLRRQAPEPGGGLGLYRLQALVYLQTCISLIGNRMAQNSGLMQGKRGVILGVANNRSIAWGIARACHAAAAEIALTWQGDALKKRVEPLARELDGLLLGHCDVTDPSSIDAVFEVLKEKWGRIDFVVHAIAFSDKDQLDGRYLETTAENFSKTMLISCYSLTAIAQRAEKLLVDGGSIVTLTYYGAEKWMPHYNVMGVAKAALEASVRYLAADLGEKNIRVNAISAGPIKTLAASGIGDFRYILKWNEYNAPLRRTVTTEEVGDSALYLLSDMSRGVTGEVHHVDSGYHVVGMKRPDAPDISLIKE
jgi:enoyl-[acyl-carrier protein] reductase I